MRVLGGCFFVDLDAPAGFLVGKGVSVFHDRIALKDLLEPFVREGPLLDAEIVGDQIKCNVCTVSDRRDIAGTVPGRSYLEGFGETGDFARGRQASGLRDVDTNVIDRR